MAHTDGYIGLNGIATLHENKIMDSGEKKSGLSRIPKLQFSFRRNNHAVSPNDRQTVTNHVLTPDDKLTVSKSAPNSNESSPTLGRSKSLRLPRSTYMAKSRSSSALDRDKERQSWRQQQAGAYQDSSAHPSQETTVSSQSSYLKPRGFSRSGSSSSPSSRHSSPGFSGGSGGDGGGYSLSQGEGGGSIPLQDFDYDEPSHFQRRTKSFSASRRTNAQTNSHASRERGVLRPSSAGRSKTPTGTSRIMAPPPSSGQNASSHRYSSHARTNSVGQVAEKTPNGAMPLSQQKVPVRRTDSSGYTSGSSGTRRGSNGSRGRRPSSVVVADGTADLNKLAKEISSSFSSSGMADTTSVEVETKSTSKLQTFTRIPTTKRVKSPPHDRNTTPSPIERSALTSSSKSYEPPSVSSSSRTRYMTPKMRSLSIEKMNAIRPNSARAYYNGSVPAADTHRPELQRPRSSAGTDHPDSNQSRRSSTPGGDHGAPVYRGSGSKGTLVTPRRTSPTPESGSTAVVASGTKVAGLPPRTPYRVAKTRGVPWTGPAGINELEGAVLLEADDYRRISNEVKSLKTALLKLKREIQADSPATPSTTTSTRVSYRTSSSSALTKKTEQIAAEREKEAQEEIAKLKKENTLKEATIERLTSELKQTKTEKQELGDKLQQMEAHRDYLLDKVERLHADKHKLEDKLNSQDKARLYERTLSTSAVMEDLDGKEGDSFEESLEVCGGKLGERKETESDIGDSLMLSDGEGESSEPESAAVCSTPIS